MKKGTHGISMSRNILQRELRYKIWGLGPQEVSWGAPDRWDKGFHQ